MDQMHGLFIMPNSSVLYGIYLNAEFCSLILLTGCFQDSAGRGAGASNLGRALPKNVGSDDTSGTFQTGIL